MDSSAATMASVAQDVKDHVVQDAMTLDRFINFLINHMPDILFALVIFTVGRYVARLLKNISVRMMDHANYDRTVITFVSQIIYYAVMALVILSALNKLGVPTTSFIAAFGAFGLAVGLALKNNLSNFASGILILIFKPFKSGDWVIINGVEGSIKAIQVLYTAVVTKDNKTVFIPNSIITSSQVTNSSYLDERFIPLLFDISYDNDHHKAIAVLKSVFQNDSRILNGDTVEIGIKEFADSSVRIAAYPKVLRQNVTAVTYDIMSAVKDAFDANGIDIPYPQRVIYINEKKPSS